ncbi:MAG: Spermine synthase [Schlesneria sp.]|nr:Spermine synthase [Schlesneria sp.]
MDRNQATSGTLLGLFVGSGCSALIYEVVWFQQLGLVMGASAISLAILLTSFMGGMCLGSLALPRVISARFHPLRVYAALELLIGVFGLIALWSLPAVGQLYWSLGLGTNDLWMRSAVALVVLLPPTVLMGATLPAMARWVETSREGLSRLGLFYGANTFGAVLGSLLAGLYLLPQYDVATATCVAAGINAAVALIAVLAAQSSPYTAAVASSEPTLIASGRKTNVIGFVIGLSGLTALGAEVIWTRLLGLLLGPTAYTFSIVLAVFLLGLGIGSSVGAMLGRRISSPGRALAACQLLLLLAIPYSAFVIGSVLPRWLAWHPADQSAWLRISLDVARTLVALLPATCLWGASFPLAVAAAADEQTDNGLMVGKLYFCNTLGAIIGAIGISLIAIPTWGSQRAEQCLVIIAGVAGLVMLGYLAFADRTTLAFKPRLALIAGLACLCPIAMLVVPTVPRGLLAFGHNIESWDKIREFHYVSEGVDSTVVVATSTIGNRCFHISGKVEATTSMIDMRTQRMLGHLPALSHKAPRTALVVGCGSGMTAGSLLLHPSIERVVICEMESSVINAARENFAIQNYGVLNDPRTQIVVDDARHFLATTKETFDVITTDPIHPWVKGAASLYTTEFFDLCRKHLNRGGVVAQWIPLYESNEAAVKCELATFIEAFPFATIWSGQTRQKGYDAVAIGSMESTCDPAVVVRNVLSNSQVGQSFIEVEIESAETLQHMFAAYGCDLKSWLKDAQINHDYNLRLQYLAGLTPDGQIEQKMIDKIAGATAVDSLSASRRE